MFSVLSICHSVHRGHPCTGPWPHPQTCSNLFKMHLIVQRPPPPPPTSDMSKLVHYEAHIVGMRAVANRLKSLLVFNIVSRLIQIIDCVLDVICITTRNGI